MEWLDTVQCCFWGSSANFRPIFFYRATLCVSAVNAVARCPSVCLAVTFEHSIHTAEDIVKLLSRPGTVVHRSSFWPSAGTQFRGESLRRGAKYKGRENFAIFDWNHRLSRKRYELGPWLLWSVNRKSYALYRMVTFSMTFHNPVFHGHGIFEVKYLKMDKVTIG